jgi:hypothetical protein
MPQGLSTLWIIIFLASLCIGGWCFLSPGTQTLSFTCFIPSAFIGGSLLFFLFMFELLDIFAQYDLTTWAATVAILLSLGMIYVTLVEKDPELRCLLAAFTGMIFGYGTGVSFSRITQRAAAPNNK